MLLLLLLLLGRVKAVRAINALSQIGPWGKFPHTTIDLDDIDLTIVSQKWDEQKYRRRRERILSLWLIWTDEQMEVMRRLHRERALLLNLDSISNTTG